MTDVLQWLNANSGGVTAALTLVLTVATGVYVYLTGRLVRESAAAREASSRPSVGIYLAVHETHINIVNLVVDNWGSGAAKDLKFSVFQAVPGRHGVTDLSKIGFLRKGLSYLGPRQRIELFLANSIGNLDELKTKPWTISLTYSDDSGKPYQDNFVIDFAEFEGIARVGEAPLYKIAKTLETLKSNFDRMLSGSRKLPVRTYTLEEELRAGEVSLLYVKLNHLSADSWKAVRTLVNERLAIDNPEIAADLRGFLPEHDEVEEASAPASNDENLDENEA